MAKKIVYGLIALILTAAIVITCGVGSSWFTNGDIKTWFNNWGQSEPDDSGDTKDEDKDPGNDKETPPSEDNEQSLKITPDEITFGDISIEAMLLSPDEEQTTERTESGGYLLTATLKPDYGYDKVDWSIEFYDLRADNPNVEIPAGAVWSDGKVATDYLTVTPTSDGAVTAEAKCLQAFSVRIIITCSLRANPNVKATCTAMYHQEYSGTALSIELYDEPNYGYPTDTWETSGTPNYEIFGSGIYRECVEFDLPDNSAEISLRGSVLPLVSDVYTNGFNNYNAECKIYLNCSYGLIREAQSRGIELSADRQLIATANYNSESGYKNIFNFEGDSVSISICRLFSKFYTNINANAEGYDKIAYYDFCNTLYAYNQKNTDIRNAQFELTIETELTNNGKFYGNYETSAYIRFKLSAPVAPSADNIGLDKDEIMFP